MTEPSRSAASPRIAITTSAKTDHGIFALLWAGVRLAGGRAERVTEKTSGARPDDYDGLILSGGLDVHPGHYGAEADPDSRYDPGRDALELDWAKAFWSIERPMLAICRGMQLLNVARGGTISQILDDDLLKILPSSQLGYMIYRKAVEARPRARLAAIWGRRRAKVNSLHRQAVDAIGEELQISACDEHDAVQALEGPDGVFRVGVQFHPELMLYRRDMRAIFRALVQAAGRERAENLNRRLTA